MFVATSRFYGQWLLWLPFSKSWRRTWDNRADHWRIICSIGRGATQFGRAMNKLTGNRLSCSMTVVDHRFCCITLGRQVCLFVSMLSARRHANDACTSSFYPSPRRNMKSTASNSYYPAVDVIIPYQWASCLVNERMTPPSDGQAVKKLIYGWVKVEVQCDFAKVCVYVYAWLWGQ